MTLSTVEDCLSSGRHLTESIFSGCWVSCVISHYPPPPPPPPPARLLLVILVNKSVLMPSMSCRIMHCGVYTMEYEYTRNSFHLTPKGTQQVCCTGKTNTCFVIGQSCSFYQMIAPPIISNITRMCNRDGFKYSNLCT